MRYWIFKCDTKGPHEYLLNARMENLETRITWRVKERYLHEIEAGDTAFIWETGRKRGIRAVMQITSKPEEMDELETEKPYYVNADYQREDRVLGTLQERNLNIPAKKLKAIPGLEQLSVFAGTGHFTKGTNFPITDEQAKILIDQIKISQNSGAA